jgi:hypothetical protein
LPAFSRRVGRELSPARQSTAHRPDESDEFPRNGGDHDRRFLSSCQHLLISRSKSDLRLPSDGADFPREPLVPTLHALSTFAGIDDHSLRATMLPAFVMLVGRRISPLERSPGTRPR